MGWSCDARAMRTLKRISAYNGGSNYIRQAGIGKILGFYEVDTQKSDLANAIVGDVFRFIGGTTDLAEKAGWFRIEADGTVKRFPIAELYFKDMEKAKITERDIARATPA